LNKVITHYRWPTNHHSSSWTFVRPHIFEHSTPLSYSSFAYYILAISHAQFPMDLHSTHVSSMKKANNSKNFAATRLTNHRAHHNSFFRDKNKHFVICYVMVYKAMSHVTLPCMQELFPNSTLVAYNKRIVLNIPHRYGL
jgi:hypothetical protein